LKVLCYKTSHVNGKVNKDMPGASQSLVKQGKATPTKQLQ